MVEGDDIFGDGVNVAARLEGMAEPGGICCRRPCSSRCAARLDVEFEDLGEQQLKNIAEPVRVYRVRLEGRSRRRASRGAAAAGAARQAVDRRAAVRTT